MRLRPAIAALLVLAACGGGKATVATTTTTTGPVATTAPAAGGAAPATTTVRVAVAGQFCAAADLGATAVDKGGAPVRCVADADGKRARWTHTA